MSTDSKVLNVEGMSCMHCANAVKKSVGSLAGVGKVDVDLEKKKVNVEYDQEKVKLDAIKKAIEEAGYQVL